MLCRSDFESFYPIISRWEDNDIYGHINNVKYYSFFDSAVNRYLIESADLDIHEDAVVGFVVESHCQYFKPISYPLPIEIGLRVKKMSNRSVIYELGVFIQGDDDIHAAGHFVHVFVNRASGKSVAIPIKIRKALERLLTR